MIIDYNFFGLDFHGNVYDTAIPTSQLDQVTIGAGIYDEIFISVDTSINSDNERPGKWKLKNIMDAKFQNDLEAGTLDADGYTVTMIHIYRRKYLEDKDWLLVASFDYDIDYNVYSFVDRLAENGVLYEYAIVPIANSIIGETTLSDPIKTEYEGVFISDLENNFKLEYDFQLGDIEYNKNSSLITPINAKYPIAVNGSQNYRSGNISYIPLSADQISAGGTKVDGKQEQTLRNNVVNFLNKGTAKAIRNENGEMMIVVTQNVKSSSKNGSLIDIHAISFDYTEIGKLDYSTLNKSGLVGSASKSKYTFDENGEVIWE
ncbi:hypothetical protein [Enterococcus sp. N249-2]